MKDTFKIMDGLIWTSLCPTAVIRLPSTMKIFLLL